MSWTNYHSHTHFCDGTDEPDVYVQEALKRGLPAYGFSGHAPVPFDTKWAMKEEGASEYCMIIRELKDQYRDDIELYLGMEVDFVPGKVGPNAVKQRFNLDYTIGSVHFIDAFEDGRPWEIDGQHSVFLDGYDLIYDNDIEAVVTRYFELTRQMVLNDTPDVVGHLDKLKIQNVNGTFFFEDDLWYKDAVSDTLDTIASKQRLIVEVNTRGLYKKKTAEAYPSLWILKEMRDRDIPIMLNSDCHHPREICGEFEQAMDWIMRAGYEELYALIEGTWQPFTINKEGIIL